MVAAATIAGPQRREGDLPPDPPPARAEHAGGVLLVRVEVAPQLADHAHDDRVVEEHVREEDRPEGAGYPEREERRRDEHGRQHERDRDQRAHEAPAGEPDPREDVRAGEPDREGEHGRERGLPHA